MQKKKCIVCRKEKPIAEFGLKGQAIRCNDCKKKSDSKRKPNQEYFGI